MPAILLFVFHITIALHHKMTCSNWCTCSLYSRFCVHHVITGCRTLQSAVL